ncbi:MAG TPA: LytTR family DNA-binding domain-containing protein [Puia sp.]|nr:LytTR family DNA-binding domain-containing protein [Puia sp.]
METQHVKTNLAVVDYASETQNRLFNLDDLISRLTAPPGKTSFLVFRNNKYFTVRTENIAYFYVKYDSANLVSFDGQEYILNYSLDHIQNLLTKKQFFRLNRQYLINFHAVKEVEYFFARKLLVHLTVPVENKLLVPREKVSGFFDWLENR